MKAGGNAVVPIDVMVNAFCNACIVGNLFFSFLRLVTEWEGHSKYAVAAAAALSFQMTSAVISSFSDSYAVPLTPYMDIIQGSIHLIAVYFILYLLTLRAECCSHLKVSKYFNYGLAIVHMFMRISLTSINIVVDYYQIINQPNPVSPFLRQFFRMGMNVTACIVILYFETFITYTLRSAIVTSGESKVAKRLELYSFALSFIITSIFIAQVYCQAERLVHPNFIAPFQSLSWSLVLIRVVEFKDEFKKLVSSSRFATSSDNYKRAERSYI